MTSVPSGWYQNPHNRAEEMYWDGAAWSGASRRGAVIDPADTIDPALEHEFAVDDATMMRIPDVSQPVAATAAVTVQVGAVSQEQLLAFAPPQLAAQHPLAEQQFEPQQFEQHQQAQSEQTEFAAQVFGTLEPDAPEPQASTGNAFALAALILGCCGLALTAIPLLIGLVAGGIPDLLAIVFGVLGVLRGRRLHGKGIVPSLIGGVLGCLGLVAMTLGAGTLW